MLDKCHRGLIKRDQVAYFNACSEKCHTSKLIGGWGCDTGVKRMTPGTGNLAWPCRAVRDVSCVTSRASDVARDRSIGPDLGEEKPVVKGNPATNPPFHFWARPAIHGASFIYQWRTSCNILKLGSVLVHVCKLLFA